MPLTPYLLRSTIKSVISIYKDTYGMFIYIKGANNCFNSSQSSMDMYLFALNHAVCVTARLAFISDGVLHVTCAMIHCQCIDFMTQSRFHHISTHRVDLVDHKQNVTGCDVNTAPISITCRSQYGSRHCHNIHRRVSKTDRLAKLTQQNVVYQEEIPSHTQLINIGV